MDNIAKVVLRMYQVTVGHKIYASPELGFLYLRPGAKVTVSETICPKHKACKCASNGRFTPAVIVEGFTPGSKPTSKEKKFNFSISSTFEEYMHHIEANRDLLKIRYIYEY